jgi:hypothetical protein
MPDLWRDLLDETPTAHPPISTGKAWSLQTSRQPTGDGGHTHHRNMCIKPIAQSVLRAEIGRLRFEINALDKAVREAGLPPDASLDNMKQDISSAAQSLREAAIALDRVDEKFTDAFDYASTQG